MKRLFIAINLPEEVKNKMEEIINSLPKLSGEIRFSSRENWHLTISFLGPQPDEALNPILEAMKETAKDFSSPTIEFEKIILAPPNRPPRMIWLAGTNKTSKNLTVIKEKLEDTLIKNGVRFRSENRPFNAHLTLARFQSPLRNYENIQKYESINYSFIAQSLDLMESHLKRSGAEYETLTKLTFSEE